MLHEPQERIGDDAVVLLPRVGGQVAHHQPQILTGQLVFDAREKLVALRALVAAEQSRGVLVGLIHRGADPCHGCQSADLSERRDETAGSAACLPLAGTVVLEAQRSPIGGHDQTLVIFKQDAQVVRQA